MVAPESKQTEASITANNAEVEDSQQEESKEKNPKAITKDERTSNDPVIPLTESGVLQSESDKIQDVETGRPLKKSKSAVSEKPFSSFTLWEKRWIVLVASLGGFMSPLTTNIYFPALNTIAKDLAVSISDVNLTITTYMIFQGLTPSLIGSFADTRGRRPAYIVGFVLYIATNIGLALNNSYAGLIVLRCFQSAGSSGMVTLMTAVIADVVTSAERGSYIAFSSAGSILGPSISPVLGGVLSEYLGWHSIFWFLVIFSSVFAIFIITFYPETCRTVVGDGSIPPPKWNMTLLNLHKERQSRKAGVTVDMEQEVEIQQVAKTKHSFPNPMSTLRVCMEKETAIILLFGGIIYAGYYCVSTTLSTQFHAIYHLNDTELGLIFLPTALGSIMAAFTNGNLLNRNYRRHCLKADIPFEKAKQIDMSHFDIERVRLEIGMPFLATGAIFIIIYGWLLEAEVHIAGPIVIMVFMGYCTLTGFNTLSVLIIDTHRANPATASAANNLVRCLLGAGASAVANPMINAMGRGWCFTFIGLVELATVPVLLAVMKYGPEWRRAEMRKVEEKAKRREMKKREKIARIEKGQEST